MDIEHAMQTIGDMLSAIVTMLIVVFMAATILFWVFESPYHPSYTMLDEMVADYLISRTVRE